MGLQEIDLETVPAWGGSARLIRRVGRDHALDLILRAKKISGLEACCIGLVNEVVPHAELMRGAELVPSHAPAMALELQPRRPAALSASLTCTQ